MAVTFQVPKSVVQIRERKSLLVQLLRKTPCLVLANLGQVGVAEPGQEIRIRFFQKQVQDVQAEVVVTVVLRVKPVIMMNKICLTG